MASVFNSTNNPGISVTRINRAYIKSKRINIVMAQFAKQPVAQGMNEGDSVRWLQSVPVTLDVTALSTSLTDNQVTDVTASGVNFVTAEMVEYGSHATYSRFNIDTAPASTLAEIGGNWGHVGAKAIDQLLIDAAEGTTNSLNAGCGDGVNGSLPLTSGSTLSVRDLADVAAFFEVSGVPGFDFLDGSFAAVLHPQAAKHMVYEGATSSNKVTYAELHQYVDAGQKRMENGQLYHVDKFMLYSSPLIDSATQVDSTAAYRNLCLGADGLGTASIWSGPTKAKINVVKPMPSDTDPYGRRTVISWYWCGKAALLDSDRVVILASQQA